MIVLAFTSRPGLSDDTFRLTPAQSVPQSIPRSPEAHHEALIAACRLCARRLCAGVVLAAAAVVAAGAAAWVDHTTPKTVSGLSPSPPAADAASLGPQQQAVAPQIGYPDSFAILFYQEELDDGTTGDVRYETWSYYTLGREITFVNGEQVADASIDAFDGPIFPVEVRPEQFAGGMRLAQVIDAAGLTTYTAVPLECSLLPGGQTIFAAELTFGMVDGRLRYVETLPLSAEG